jgi:hypothetical protein
MYYQVFIIMKTLLISGHGTWKSHDIHFAGTCTYQTDWLSFFSDGKWAHYTE